MLSNKLLFAALVLSLSFTACQSGGPATTPTAKTDAPPTHVMHLSNTDTLPFPVIAEFDELAPIFHQQNDTTYVINFWATWCGPCVEELPYFEQLAEEYADQPLQIVLVSLDFKKYIRTKLLRFVEDRPLDLPVIALTDNKTNVWIDRVDPEWSGAIPITIVYRKDKRRFAQDQFSAYEELTAMVEAVQ